MNVPLRLLQYNFTVLGIKGYKNTSEVDVISTSEVAINSLRLKKRLYPDGF